MLHGTIKGSCRCAHAQIYTDTERSNKLNSRAEMTAYKETVGYHAKRKLIESNEWMLHEIDMTSSIKHHSNVLVDHSMAS